MCGGPSRAGGVAAEGAGQPGAEEPSPRLRRILLSLGLTPSPCILSCEAAVSMDVEVFGTRTEEVREWAFHSLAASAGWCRSHTLSSAPAVAAVLDAQTALTVPAALGAQTALVVPAPAAVDAHVATVVTVATCQEGAAAGSAVALRCGTVQPTSRAAASAAPATGCTSRAAVLAGEESDIERAVDEFLSVVPRALLLCGHSALSDEDRVAARRVHLLTCGASSVRAGTAFVRAWLRFCERRRIPCFGVPVDADLMQAFLMEVDTDARQRAASRNGRRTGASVQHATACAARWTADHAGLPFSTAKTTLVRKSSAPSREREPSWSEMWEPAILAHLLRVAVNLQHDSIVRAMAASVYFVCVASMRLVDGQRSAPPVLDDRDVFHGVAVLSKGRRRSAMAPKPWSVPCVSPDGSMSDRQVAVGLLSAVSSFPPNCCSMFPRLVNTTGKEVARESAPIGLQNPPVWSRSVLPAPVETACAS
mmetsp:Transcript_40352/g.100112  ORF Transcript_40352/g.100112 Transcript_40352/m.100112 type:complete len:479 (-) Transcript_40352:2025-3461(-)